MDVLFHVLFHIMPPTVVSDVCKCVPHPYHHQTLNCAACPPSIHFAPCQSPTPPCLSPCQTPVHHGSSTATLLLDVFTIVIVLVTIERVCDCDGMHPLFPPIINTLCVCHFGATQSGHHFALVLWLWCLLFTTPLCFTHTHTQQLDRECC